jgi:hypothetical protein
MTDAPPAVVTDLGWCLTAKEPDMAFSYRWTIEDFKNKMETFKLGQQLESSQFVINGLKLCINLYPNGRNGEEDGFVSLFLRNDNAIQMEVMCEFVLGVKNTFRLGRPGLRPSASACTPSPPGTTSASIRSIRTRVTDSRRCTATSRSPLRRCWRRAESWTSRRSSASRGR